MATNDADAARLLIAIELATNKATKQLGALVAASGKAAKSAEDKFAAANLNLNTGNTVRSLNNVRTQVSNLSFQLNDIGTSLAGGASPFQVMAQQGGQVAQVFQQMGGGLKGAVAGLGAAFGSILNPVTAISLAMIFLIGKTYEYFTAADEGSKKATAELEKHAATVQAIADKYGEAYPALKKYSDELRASIDQGKLQEATQIAIAARFAAVEDVVNNLGDAATELALKLSAMIPQDQISTVGDFEKAMADLQKKAKEHTLTVDDLNAVSKQLADFYRSTGIPEASAMAGVMATLAGQTSQAAKAAKELKDQSQGLGDFFQRSPLGGLSTGAPFELGGDQNVQQNQRAHIAAASDAGDARRIIRGQSSAGVDFEHLTDDFAKKLGALLDAFPDVKVVSGARSVEKQAAIVASGVRPAAPPGKSRHNFGEAADLSIPAAQRTAVEQFARLIGLNNPVKNDSGHFQNIGPRQSDRLITESGGGRQKKANTDLDDWLKKSRESIELGKQQAEINGDLSMTVSQRSAEIEKAKFIQEGMNEAVKQYGTVSPQQKAQIEATADAMAKQGLAAKDALTANQQFIDSQQRMIEQIQQFNQQVGQVFSGAISGFINDLVAGKDAGEAFKNMLANIGQQLLQLSLNLLFKQLLGGALGGAGGGLANIFPAAPVLHRGGKIGFGGGDSRHVSPGVFAGAKRFHGGGMPGLRPDEIPAILQRGETVIPRGPGRSSGGANVYDHSRVTIKIDRDNNTTVQGNVKTARQLHEAVRYVLRDENRNGGINRQNGGGRF